MPPSSSARCFHGGWHRPTQSAVGGNRWDPTDCQDDVDALDGDFESWDRTISLVVQADRDLKAAQLILRRQVGPAPRAGHSWASIGVVLGITR